MAKVRYESGEQDGATAIAHELDVKAALANASAKLLSVKNATVEKLIVDKDGHLTNPATTLELTGYKTTNVVPALIFKNSNSQGGNSTNWEFHNTSGLVLRINENGTIVLNDNIGITCQGGANYIKMSYNLMQLQAGTVRIDPGSNLDIQGLITNTNAAVYGGRVAIQAVHNDPLLLNCTSGNGQIDSDRNNGAGGTAFILNASTEQTYPNALLFSSANNAVVKFSITAFGELNFPVGASFVNTTVDGAPVYSAVTIQIINNTFDSGDKVTFTYPWGTTLEHFEQGVDFTVGADATATATNLKDAINTRANLKDVVIATSIGDTVTVTNRLPGYRGRRWRLSETDGATNNFTLGGIDSEGYPTTGDNTGLGFIFDTTRTRTNAPTRRLASFRSDNIEVFSISPKGGINVRRSSTASSVNSAGEVIIGVTDTSVARDVTLDTDDLVAGRIIIIKDESGAAGTNNITVKTEGGAGCTIDGVSGATGIPISVNYGVLRVYSDGTNWFSW